MLSSNKDYLLKVKIQNNKIVSLMKERGIINAAQLARDAGISQSRVGDFLNMTASPFSRKANEGGSNLWAPAVEKIAASLGVKPEEMFNEQQMSNPLLTNKAERALSREDMESLCPLMIGGSDPILAIEDEEEKKIISKGLECLSPREKRVIKGRFGFDGPLLTFKDLGKELEISISRIMQIEAKALRKLRMPKNQMPGNRERSSPTVLRCLTSEDKEKLLTTRNALSWAADNNLCPKEAFLHLEKEKATFNLSNYFSNQWDIVLYGIFMPRKVREWREEIKEALND